jgi:hypothetical protein
MSREVTEELLKRLWSLWGTREAPAEWDGRVYGGGKLSQRFWEYHWAIREADFDRDSVVLDVGAGRTLFFPRLLEGSVARVVAYDPQCEGMEDERLTVVPKAFSATTLLARGYTHAVSISVIEHIEQGEKAEFFAALDQVRAPLVLTLELGPKAHGANVVMRDLYDLTTRFSGHYCSRVESCPVWADDALGTDAQPLWRPLGIVMEPQ